MEDSPSGLKVPQAVVGTANVPSTTTSTLAGDDYGLDKKDADHSPSEDGGEEKGKEEPDSEELSIDEYPSGIKLLFIVVALVMSIFLLALDMVSLMHRHGRHSLSDNS
jgi:hypothetical protein